MKEEAGAEPLLKDDIFGIKDEKDDHPHVKTEVEDINELYDQKVDMSFCTIFSTGLESTIQKEASCINQGPNKVFPCEQCGQIFRAAGDRKRHLVKHTGDKPYPCQICGALFRDKYGVKRNMNIHANTKPFTCIQCDKHSIPIQIF